MHLVQDLYKSTETVYICNLLKVDSHGLSHPILTIAEYSKQ